MTCSEGTCWNVQDQVPYDEMTMLTFIPNGENFAIPQTTYEPCKASRTMWVAEVGNPAMVPSETFWKALSDKNGPLQTYVNPRYGTNYSDAFTAFMEMCQYVSRAYVGGNSYTDGSGTTWSYSNVSVDCNVFGLRLTTTAFQDCNYPMCADTEQNNTQISMCSSTSIGYISDNS